MTNAASTAIFILAEIINFNQFANDYNGESKKVLSRNYSTREEMN